MSVKVLIADDDEGIHELFQHVFRKELAAGELEFFLALDGQQAWELLTANPDIRISLLDIYMPKIDGLTLLEQLRQSYPKGYATHTCIVISAIDDLKNIRAAMNMLAFDFLTKPIDLNDLHLTLDKAIKYSHHLREVEAQQQLAQSVLEQANEELEQRILERTAELDAFAHTAAHDLKAPLGNVIGYIDYIEEYAAELSPEEFKKALKKIREAGQRGIKIVDELLLLAGIGKSAIKITPLDMGKIVDSVLYDLDLVIEQYKGTITVPERWPVVKGYAPWIEVVWTNYILNGLKYGGNPPQLELGYHSLEESKHAVSFWIKDNGSGLTVREQDSLFKEFTRLDESDSQGHGLGLATVRRIIEKLNGQVGVHSKAGQGSTFFFTLPKG